MQVEISVQTSDVKFIGNTFQLFCKASAEIRPRIRPVTSLYRAVFLRSAYEPYTDPFWSIWEITTVRKDPQNNKFNELHDISHKVESKLYDFDANAREQQQPGEFVFSSYEAVFYLNSLWINEEWKSVYLKYRRRSNWIPNEIDNVKKLSALFFQIFRKGWIYIF